MLKLPIINLVGRRLTGVSSTRERMPTNLGEVRLDGGGVGSGEAQADELTMEVGGSESRP